MNILAYKTEHDISITFDIYNWAYGREETTGRLFYLRNLKGNSQAEQVEQAARMIDEVARELYYLTGFGIDKGVVKVGSTKVVETTYPDLVPQLENMRFIDALLFKFRPTYCYHWVRSNHVKLGIQDRELADGWQKTAMPVATTASFRLPVVALSVRASKAENGYSSFFLITNWLRKKRKRTNYGFSVHYDRNDPTFTSFIARFYEDGHLSFGDRRYFGSQSGYYLIEGRKWPLSKAKPEKQPRFKSRLASQPTDNTEYVYVIRAGRTNAYKIGKSNDPQGRLMSLQTASHHQLNLLHTFTADNASAAEEELHRLLHHQRLEGEWFKVSPQQKAIITLIQRFEHRQFWVNDKGLTPGELFHPGAV